MSIYIQITNRCNMHCAHCCFSCTARGSDMTREHFHAAIAIAKDNGAHITIGGGEPTLHPLFKEFVSHAIWELADIAEDSGMPSVHMVTNGSNTETALTLAKLAKRGIISATVSHDEYHDPIDPRVYKAFEKPKTDYYSHKVGDDHDCRGVNGGGGMITKHGRAKSWGNNPYITCNCDSLFITPKGDIFPCGCRKGKLGNLSDADLHIGSEHFQGLCSKNPNYKEQLEEAMC